MSDSRADAVKEAISHPVSASEKLARTQLIEKQIEMQGHKDSTDPVLQKKFALLGNMTELEQIRMDILMAISQYSSSTPEFYQLKALAGGRDDPFEIADYLAREVHDSMKTELLMSYYTPSRSSVREKFVEHAKKGAAVRGLRLAAVETKALAKESMFAGYIKSLGSGGASSSGGASKPN